MGLDKGGPHPGGHSVRRGAYLGDEGLRRGIRVKTSSFTRHHVNIMMTKTKTVGNYVNSILAKLEAVQAGYDEALLLDTPGYLLRHPVKTSSSSRTASSKRRR